MRNLLVKKSIAILLIAVTALSISLTTFAANGTWKKDSKGWWYSYTDGGYAKNTWEKIDGSWYYFNSAGYMSIGWQQIGGKWYYFGSSGIMQTGWVKSGGKWYYMNSSGIMVTGWQQIGTKWYCFNSSGIMLTGWVKSGGKWYYMNSSGVMQTGWQKISNKWYYFKSSGVMVTGTQTIDGKTYTFDSNGVWQSGTSTTSGWKEGYRSFVFGERYYYIDSYSSSEETIPTSLVISLGLYDMNTDGIPELFIVAVGGARGSIFVYTWFNNKVTYAGEITLVNLSYDITGKYSGIFVSGGYGALSTGVNYITLSNGKLFGKEIYYATKEYNSSVYKETIKDKTLYAVYENSKSVNYYADSLNVIKSMGWEAFIRKCGY